MKNLNILGLTPFVTLAFLRSNYSVHLLAHSQGNVVAAEALRLWAQQRPGEVLLDSYIAIEAAIPGGIYDPNCREEWVMGKNDLFQHYPDGNYNSLPYMMVIGYINGNNVKASAGIWINLHNQDDAVLKQKWAKNQTMKPYIFNKIPEWLHYSYEDKGDNIYYRAIGVPRVFPKPIPAAYIIERLRWRTQLYVPSDIYEIFSFCISSRTRALGLLGQIWPFDDNHNLQTWAVRGLQHGEIFQDFTIGEGRGLWDYLAGVSTTNSGDNDD